MVKKSKSKSISVCSCLIVGGIVGVLLIGAVCREQEQENTVEEEVQGDTEGQGAPQEESQGGEEAWVEAKAEGGEGPRDPQWLAF